MGSGLQARAEMIPFCPRLLLLSPWIHEFANKCMSKPSMLIASLFQAQSTDSPRPPGGPLLAVSAGRGRVEGADHAVEARQDLVAVGREGQAVRRIQLVQVVVGAVGGAVFVMVCTLESS